MPERDGDRIYAVVNGIAGSSDGKGLGLTAPRKEGKNARLSAPTGRPGYCLAPWAWSKRMALAPSVGDRTELQTLTEIFNAGGALSAIGRPRFGEEPDRPYQMCSWHRWFHQGGKSPAPQGNWPPTQNIEKPNSWYDATTAPSC